MQNEVFSPLRYPGGKATLAKFMTDLITLNEIKGGIYYELYAGGAGAALNLLYNNVVKKIVINDADYRIYSFWHSILHDTNKFIELLDRSPVNIDEWKKQREVYVNAANENILNVGYATFFLNRTNRSGIIHKAGPIGGMEQKGNYLIDVRFNKESLKHRIKNISNNAERISLHNLTTEDFLSNIKLNKKELNSSFFYLDPPYYYKGKVLYLNNYVHDEHKYLSGVLKDTKIKYWMVSYDNVIQIRKMYSDFRMSKFNLNYSLQAKRQASELLIFSDNLNIPNVMQIRNKKFDLEIS